jgi:uncharacterized protein YecE (DUF72 family)
MSLKVTKNTEKQTKIGPAGWSYKDWQGVVYPVRRGKTFSELEYISGFFDTVEINSTFYRPPRAETCKEWIKKTLHNSRFEFTVKLWQQFTHERGSLTSVDVKTFKESINPLAEGDRLGALLIQFPWSFKNSDESRQYINKLNNAFSEFPLVIEFRHKSWQVPAVVDFLHQNEICFVNIDQPVIGKSISPSAEVTSDIAYVRFHGRNYTNWFRKDAGRDARYDYLYSESEMAEWIKDLKELEEKAEKSFIIYNNHFQGKAVVNGLQLMADLTQNKVRVPEALRLHYPQLSDIATQEPRDRNLSLF